MESYGNRLDNLGPELDALKHYDPSSFETFFQLVDLATLFREFNKPTYVSALIAAAS